MQNVLIACAIVKKEEFTKTALHCLLSLTSQVLWQILFSKIRSFTPYLTVWCWLPFLPLRCGMFIPFPWISHACENSRSNVAWPSRVGHKRQHSFLTVLLGYSFLEPTHQTPKKPWWQRGAMCRGSSQQTQLRSSLTARIKLQTREEALEILQSPVTMWQSSLRNPE